MDKNQATPKNKSTAPTFTKKIGRTTYEVSVYFDENARENLHKKLERIILNAVQYDDF